MSDPIIVQDPDRWRDAANKIIFSGEPGMLINWNPLYQPYGPITEAEHAQHVAARLLNETPHKTWGMNELVDDGTHRNNYVTAEFFRGRQWIKP